MPSTIDPLLQPAVLIGSGTSYAQAVELLNQHQTDRLYIDCESSWKVICDFALLKCLLRGEACSTPLACLASPIQDSLSPGQSLEQAAVFFRTGIHRELPVIDAGEIVGVVRRVDLLNALIADGVPSMDDSVEESHGEHLGDAELKIRRIG